MRRMRSVGARRFLAVAVAVAAALQGIGAAAYADDRDERDPRYDRHDHDRYDRQSRDGRDWNQWESRNVSGRSFERIATLPVYRNNQEIADSTVAEIVSASKDGRWLVYTDASRGIVGFIHIGNPHFPIPAGTLDVGGSPTSVAVVGNRYVLAAVDTSESFTSPSGQLKVIDLETRNVIATHELGGQPDSIALGPDGSYGAIVLENQRDEEIEVDGVEGGLPQLPSGALMIVDLKGDPQNWTFRTADLTGLSNYAPTDAEAEFVDINERNEAVVSLQENNHIAIVDLRTGKVVDDFAAGTVDLDGVDANEDGLIALTDSLEGIAREPDAVAWVPGASRSPRGKGRGNGYGYGYSNDGYGYDNRRSHDERTVRNFIATANEGDLFGGSRGFTIFDRHGGVVFDSGSSFEEIAVRHGHYNEDRSENKGSEPEAIEYGRFGDTDYLFVASERGSFIAVYTLGRDGKPTFEQFLPAPLGPEGLLAIPERGLLIASGEEDDPSFGVRSTLMIYELGVGRPSYPQIVSADDEGKPIGWSALSGLTALPGRGDKLLGVWDSYYSEGRIFTIDASTRPAVIESAIPIQGGTGDWDNEGITLAPDDTYWIASEGNASDSVRNRLIQTDTQGIVLAEVTLPPEIEACRAASTLRGTLGSGFEGVTAVPVKGGYMLAIAQQRGWDYTTPECEALDDDPAAADAGEPGFTRIWLYDPKTGEWDDVAYELEPLPENASWVGLSEITHMGNSFVVLERDNRTGDFGELKTLVKFSARALEDGVVSRNEKSSYDMIGDLEANNGWMTDKPEGVAVTPEGRVYVVTDNDGVDEWSGETWFLRLGSIWKLFR